MAVRTFLLVETAVTYSVGAPCCWFAHTSSDGKDYNQVELHEIQCLLRKMHINLLVTSAFSMALLLQFSTRN